MLLKIPGQYQDFSRQTKAIDYIDLVQIATVFMGQDMEALVALPALKKLKVQADDLKFQEQLHEARWMLIRASESVGAGLLAMQTTRSVSYTESIQSRASPLPQGI